MVTREDLVAEVQKVPEEYLAEIYTILKAFENKNERKEESQQSVMAQLRQIKISAAPDFSTKADLYELENRNA